MTDFLILIAGLVVLLTGANFLVDGSASLAKRFNVPGIAIGLTIVAFGTSLPELIVNIHAVIANSSDIALGNIVGSSIANILLILGVTALVAPLFVSKNTASFEIPLALFAALLLFLFIALPGLDFDPDSELHIIHGIILLSFFAIFLVYIYYLIKTNKKLAPIKETAIKKLSILKTTLFIIGGLAGLYLGGEWTVNGAVAIARNFGMSEYLISLTIVGIGTSLPEMVTSIIAVIKKNQDLAIGNIIGSNIFNIFWVLGVSSLFMEIQIPKYALADSAVLLASSILLLLYMHLGKKNTLTRLEGMSFFVFFLAYLAFLIVRV